MYFIFPDVLRKQYRYHALAFTAHVLLHTKGLITHAAGTYYHYSLWFFLHKPLAMKTLRSQLHILFNWHVQTLGDSIAISWIVIASEWHLISHGSKTLPLPLWMMIVLRCTL